MFWREEKRQGVGSTTGSDKQLSLWALSAKIDQQRTSSPLTHVHVVAEHTCTVACAHVLYVSVCLTTGVLGVSSLWMQLVAAT